MATIRSLLVKIGFQTNTGPLDRAHRKTDSFKRTASGLGKAMRMAAGGMAAFTAGRVALAAVDKRLEFGKDLALLQTFLGGNVKRVGELEGSIRDLAKNTGKPVGDVTRGMSEIVSAFGDGSETVAKTSIALDAARAGFTDTLSAVKLLSVVTKNYGDTSAAAMRHVSDLSFQVVKDGQTSFPELAGSMGRVAPVAKSAGVNMQELFAVFSTGTGVIGDAATVGTAARAAIVQMLNPTVAMKKALKGFNKEGIKTGSDLIKRKGLVGAMRALVDSTDGSAESISQLFKNVRGQGLVLALTGAQAETFDRKLAAMGRTTGNTARAVGAATGGFNAIGAAMKRADAQAADMQIQLGESLAPAMLEAKQFGLELAKVLSDDLGEAFKDVENDADNTLDVFKAIKTIVMGIVKVIGVLVKGTAALGGALLDLAKIGIDVGVVAAASATGQTAAGKRAIKKRFMDRTGRTVKSRLDKLRELGGSIAGQAGADFLGNADLAKTREIASLGRRALGGKGGDAESRLEVRIERLVAQLPEGYSAEDQGRIIASRLEKVLVRSRRDMARKVRRGAPRPADLAGE